MHSIIAEQTIADMIEEKVEYLTERDLFLLWRAD